MSLFTDNNVEVIQEDFHYQFSVWNIVSVLVMNCVATVSNGVCVHKISKTYNINQALYATLLLCAVTTTFGIALALIISLAFLAFQDDMQSKLVCSIWSSPAYACFFMGQHFTCTISALR